MALEQEVYLSIPEAARYIGVSRVTFWRWCNEERSPIPLRRYDSGTVRIPQSWLVAYLKARDEKRPA